MAAKNKAPLEQMPLQQVSVISITTVGRESFVMRIPRCANFAPGQVIAVTTTKSIPPRLFSLCSGIDDPYWEILFNIKHDGVLSPKLAHIKSGDPLHVSQPFGTFIDTANPSWWIAAGTGIAPFRAMLRSGLGPNKRLLHGARRAHGFYFASEFQPILTSRYIRCCSQEALTECYNGRLTKWLQEQPSVPTDIAYLLCGSAEMVVQIRDILLAKGVLFENIQSEIYF